MYDQPDSAVNVNKLLKLTEEAYNSAERSQFRLHWEELAQYLLPTQRANFLGITTPGTKKANRLYAPMPIQFNHDLASTIHSTLTNPATKWSRLKFSNETLNDDPFALEWLEEARNLIHQELNDSNFDAEAGKNYQFYTSLGNMALLHEAKDFKDDGKFGGFRFTALHLSETAWCVNADWRVDKMYRKFKLTAYQALERFGKDNLSGVIQKALDSKPEEQFPFVHCIYPREKDQIVENSVGRSLAHQRPYASVYICETSKEVVEEDGYYEFPVHVARYDLAPNEKYGTGPGTIALPGVKRLNKIHELGMEGLETTIRPPWVATQRNILSTLNLRANQLTILRDIDGLKPLNTGANLNEKRIETEILTSEIKSCFFLDKLMLPPRDEVGEMTAFEVAKRSEQMQMVFGPALGRLNVDYLSPIITRCFKMLYRAHRLPPLPPSLQEKGVHIDIEFVNQLARSQRIEEVTNARSFLEEAAFMAQMNPQALDIIDFDGLLYNNGRILGISEKFLKTEDQVAKIRKDRTEQQQQAQTLAAGTQLADMASKIVPGGPQSQGNGGSL